MPGHTVSFPKHSCESLREPRLNSWQGRHLGLETLPAVEKSNERALHLSPYHLHIQTSVSLSGSVYSHTKIPTTYSLNNTSTHSGSNYADSAFKEKKGGGGGEKKIKCQHAPGAGQWHARSRWCEEKPTAALQGLVGTA